VEFVLLEFEYNLSLPYLLQDLLVVFNVFSFSFGKYEDIVEVRDNEVVEVLL
jgi:hypothetical protein